MSARPSWSQALDFVGPRVSTAVWSWALLAGGVVAMMSVVEGMERIEHDLVDAQQQFRRLSLADRQRRLTQAIEQGPSSGRPAPGAVAVPEVAPLRGVALADGLGMARLLAYPWASTLNRIEDEAAAHQVVLMALSIDLVRWGPGQGEGSEGAPLWRLQAAVRDDASALAWAARLPGGQLLSRDRLVQGFATEAGTYVLKIDAEMAGWGRTP